MLRHIPNGWTLEPMSAAELAAWCRGRAADLAAVRTQILSERISRTATRIYDDWTIGIASPEGTSEIPSTEAIARLQARCDAPRPDEVSKQLDLSSSVILFPLASRTLVLFYAHNDELNNFWSTSPGLEPFWYSDTATQPADITTEEWNTRAALWDKALGKNKPGQVGLRFIFTNRKITLSPLPRALEDYIPMIEDRAERTAREFYIKEEEKKLRDKGIVMTGQIMSNIQDSMDTVGGFHRINDLMRLHRRALTEPLTSQHLRSVFTKPDPPRT